MSVKSSLFLVGCGAIALGLSWSRQTPADAKLSQQHAANDTHPAMNHPDRYAWEVFIELNRPAAEGKPDAIWETWATDADCFPSKPNPSKPPQWPGPKSPQKVLKPSTQLVLSRKQREKVHAAVVPLSSPPAPTVEEIRRNKIEFDYIVDNHFWYLEGLEEAFKTGQRIEFPLGAIAVKARWKPIKEKDKWRYHWNVDAAGELQGLTALHISSKVLPNWFWATFEHVDNPERGKDLGCFDSFGVDPPNSCTGKVSPALLRMLKGAHMGPEWQYYRLNGTQIDFTDSTGRPTLLGNSQIEGPQGVMLTSSCMTCHAKAVIDGSGHFLPIEKQSSPPEGDVGIPNPDWFYNSSGARKTLQLAFTWGFLNANSINPPPPSP